MTIVLNHTIVPVGDKQRGAAFLADLLGVATGAPVGPFVPVRINDDLTFDFDDRWGARPGHYAFLVDDATFDAALDCARRAGREWVLDPRSGGRGVYVRDPDGIAYELFTVAP
jgi:catechol 2,3-dioxygenase-like lactoylglutathione lyase family enzyme